MANTQREMSYHHNGDIRGHNSSQSTLSHLSLFAKWDMDMIIITPILWMRKVSSKNNEVCSKYTTSADSIAKTWILFSWFYIHCSFIIYTSGDIGLRENVWTEMEICSLPTEIGELSTEIGRWQLGSVRWTLTGWLAYAWLCDLDKGVQSWQDQDQDLTSRESYEKEKGINKQPKLNENQVNLCFMRPTTCKTERGWPKKNVQVRNCNVSDVKAG